MKYYSGIKNNEILLFATIWIELEYYAKQSKSVRERQIPYDFTHMWDLRNKTDEHMGGGRKRKKKEGNKPQATLKGREQTEGC